MEKKTVMEGSFESSKSSMRRVHQEMVIKLPKIKVTETKKRFKKIIKFLCFWNFDKTVTYNN